MTKEKKAVKRITVNTTISHKLIKKMRILAVKKEVRLNRLIEDAFELYLTTMELNHCG